MSWFKRNVRVVLFAVVLLLATGAPVQARVMEQGATSAECAGGFPLIWQWFIQLFTRYAMAAN